MVEAKVTLLTREFPPDIYGGAGVHVDYLSRSLSKIMQVEVRCFGEQNYTENNLKARGFQPRDLFEEEGETGINQILETLSTDLAMIKESIKNGVIHAHTWYTMLAGFLAKKLYGLPLVVTVHSMEPLRPWKREQLGNGYLVSSWMEKMGIENADRIVAVSEEMRKDIIRYFDVDEEKIIKIYNGIDLNQYHQVESREALNKYNINKDYILFVGRLSRQKGIIHLLEAVEYLEDDIQIVICAGKPDTEDLLQEVESLVEQNENVIWINKMLAREEVIELYSQARVFVCPSIYEPFGIINLEAMACKTPVVASSVGGIKEVVVDGKTGLLVPPGDSQELARAISNLLQDEKMQQEFGEAGRKRVEEHFSWDSIARQTKEMYLELL